MRRSGTQAETEPVRSFQTSNTAPECCTRTVTHTSGVIPELNLILVA